MWRVTDRISLQDDELEERFVRSSGPGGQNVNKVSTAVELRFRLWDSSSLAQHVKERMATLAGRRLTEEGVLIIQANRFRTQERNREDARERLFEMIRTAAIAPVPRIATRPSRGSRAERVDEKTRRGVVKKLRQTKVSWD